MVAKASTDSPRRALPTRRAAEYLGISTSLLRKLRLRRPGDPGGAGPDFVRLGPNLIVYELIALDRWLDERAAQSSSGAKAA